MGKISVTSLQVGMVLSEDVKDRNGRLLLNSGMELSDRHLRILKIWGVTEVDIDGQTREAVEERITASIDGDLMTACEEWMVRRFRHNDMEIPAVAELLRFCTVRKAQEMTRLGLGPESLVWVPLVPQASHPGEVRDPAAIIEEDLELGSLPVVFHKLVEVVNDSRSSASDVAEIISNDTDLSARLLRLVNSAFYGLRSKIDTISRAVAIIGSNQLVSLAMGISVITSFQGVPESLINMQSFWRHSLACGIIGRILASYHSSPNTERFFVAGLLHDIGRLVIYKHLPEHARYMLEQAGAKGVLLTDMEREVLGFSHEALGGELLNQWKVPVSLETNVRFHHSLDQAPNRMEAAILQVSDVLANAFEQGSSGERYVPVLTADCWETLDLPVSVISQTAIQMDYQIDEILQFFTQES